MACYVFFNSVDFFSLFFLFESHYLHRIVFVEKKIFVHVFNVSRFWQNNSCANSSGKILKNSLFEHSVESLKVITKFATHYIGCPKSLSWLSSLFYLTSSTLLF